MRYTHVNNDESPVIGLVLNRYGCKGIFTFVRNDAGATANAINVAQMDSVLFMSAKAEEITALYVAEHGRLERQIYRRVGCRAAACDLVHDIFLRLWEKATDRKGNESAYLTRCARNAAIDHIRAERTRVEFFGSILPEQYASDPTTPHEILSARQHICNIDEVLAALPKQTRHIFLLNRIHGKSFSEIASVLNISQRAVAKHMARAVKACDDIA